MNIKEEGEETHGNSCLDPVGLTPLKDIDSLQLNPVGSLVPETKPWLYQEECWSGKSVMMSDSRDFAVVNEEKLRSGSGGSIELCSRDFKNKPLVKTNPFLSYMPVNTPPGSGMPDEPLHICIFKFCVRVGWRGPSFGN